MNNIFKTSLFGVMLTLAPYKAILANTCQSILGQKTSQLSIFLNRDAHLVINPRKAFFHIHNATKVIKENKIAPTKEDLSLLYYTIKPHLQDSEPRTIAQILSLFKVHDFTDADILEQIQDISILKIDDFNEKDLTQSLSAFASLGVKPKHEYMQKWKDQAYAQMHNFNPRGLTEVMAAFAKLKHIPNQSFLNKWSSISYSKLDSFNPQDLSSSMYAIATLGIKPKLDFLNAWDQQVINKVQSFNSQDLSTSMYALGLLKIRPSETFLNAWTVSALKKTNTFNSKDIANSLYGFANFDVSPSSNLLDAFMKRASDLSDSLTIKDTLTIAYPLFLLRETLLVLDFFELLSETQLNELKASKEPENISLLATIAVYNDKVLNDQTVKDLLDLNIESIAFERPEGHTALEDKMAEQLDKSNINYSREYKTAAGFFVDFYVPQTKLIIQVDGPYHFITDLSGQFFLRAQDKRFNELHIKLGYTVKRIDYIELDNY